VPENTDHLRLPRGFRDAISQRAHAHQQLRHEWVTATRMAGFEPVEVPPVGFAKTFTTGHHAAGQKLYRFPDRRGRELALVSDSLPAVLRLAYGRNLPEQRVAYCCPIFRYERRPRRHFHHLGAMEVRTGSGTQTENQRSTSRLACLVANYLSPRLPVRFTLTDPGLWRSLTTSFLPSEAASHLLHLLDRTRPDQRPARLHAAGAPIQAVRVAEHLARDPACSNSTTSSLGELASLVEDTATGSHALAEHLTRTGTAAEVNLGELHASEFHDGPSFLIRPAHTDRLLGDGGTFGLFARAFLGTFTSVHSTVIGLERLAELIEPPEHSPAHIAILASPQPESIEAAERLNTELRAVGIGVWDTVLTRPLRHQLRNLAAIGIPYSLLVGPREVAGAGLTVRGLDGSLHPVPRENLAGWLLDVINNGRCP
jgi:ATP phosphoribosyltransferase regulatory subunit HisZ